MAIDNQFNPTLGIDLGTTFSAIAWWNGRGPEHYQHLGKDTLQSVVYCDPKSGELLVGELAYKKGLQDGPETMIVGVKRMMDDASQNIALSGKEFSPIEISARILKQAYANAAATVPSKPGLKSRGTVVTVPYYFKAHQCENTRRAAELAEVGGTGEISILQEPIAASLAYTWELVDKHPEREHEENILVFDLGGGTFDLTLFRLEQTKDKLLFEVLATGGDDRLGGMDFDKCLSDLIFRKSGKSLEGLSEREERRAKQTLMAAAVEAKISLAHAPECDVIAGNMPSKLSFETRVSREEFEECIRSYTDKIETIMERLWETPNLSVKRSQVDRVIRIGGSSRIPLMKRLLEDHVGDKVWGNTDEILSVVRGAAMYSAFLDDPEIFGREIEICTRTCHALGVETSGGRFEVVIPANLKTPCERRKTFTFDADGMTAHDINVYQGASRLVANNALIGTVPVSGLPGRPKGELDIWVTFKVSEEQTLSVVVEAEGVHTTGSLKFA
jgi:molecular chaperone DnaK